MSRTHCPTCPHGLGLNCRTCYDQRFGLDFGRPRIPPTTEQQDTLEADTRAVVDRLMLDFHAL